MVQQPLPVPEFYNFFNTNLTTPLVLSDFPDRFCKKPDKTICFTRFSRILCVFLEYNKMGCVSLEKFQASGKFGETNGFICFFLQSRSGKSGKANGVVKFLVRKLKTSGTSNGFCNMWVQKVAKI